MKAIMYHYVRRFAEALPFFRYLDVGEFEKQLLYFKHKFGFVSKGDFLASLDTGESPPGVVFTFDDGFKDHVDYVVPILRKMGAWGIFYIPTGIFNKSSLLNVHRIHVMIGKHGGERVFEAIKPLIHNNMLTHGRVREFRELTYRTQDNDGFTTLVKRTLNYYLDRAYHDMVLDQLSCALLPDESSVRSAFYVSHHDVATLQSEGMIVGSHGMSHALMSTLPRLKQEEEIVESFSLLEKITGGLEVKTFCYPYGGYYSYSAETVELLAKTGCRFSFSVEQRDISGADLRMRRHALPRYDCNQFSHGSAACAPRANQGMQC